MSTIKNKICNKSSSNINKKNTLLEKYYLHQDGNTNNNLLAVKLLESKIKISHRLGGLHRLLIIIKSDLLDLIYSDSLDRHSTIHKVTGLSNCLLNVKKFLYDIIKIIDKLIKPRSTYINLIEELENPLIESININLMNNKNINHAKELLKQILILFYINMPPFGDYKFMIH